MPQDNCESKMSCVSDKPSHPLFKSEVAKGTCRVMCFHPKSNITLPLMSIEEILEVIEAWIKELLDLGAKFKWVQVRILTKLYYL